MEDHSADLSQGVVRKWTSVCLCCSYWPGPQGHRSCLLSTSVYVSASLPYWALTKCVGAQVFYIPLAVWLMWIPLRAEWLSLTKSTNETQEIGLYVNAAHRCETILLISWTFFKGSSYLHCGSSVDITGQEFTALICQESDKVGAFFFSFCFLFFVLLLLFFKQILRGRGRRINLY